MANRRKLIWLGAVVAAILAFVGAAGGYYNAARAEWMAKASTPELQEALRSSPNDVDLLFITSRRLWERDGKAADALPLAERAARLAPRRAEGQLSLGYLGLRLHRPAEALYHFERATELDSRLRFAHSGAGAVYVDAGMPDDAIRHLEQAWDPKDPEVPVRLNLVKALTEKGRLEEADRLCMEALRYTPPGAVVPYQQLYRIRKGEGRGATVKDEMYRLIRRSGFMLTAPFYGELAFIVLDQGSGPAALREAERLAAQARRAGREDRGALEITGAVLALQGKHAKAVESLRQAVRLDPKPARTRKLLATSLRALGKNREADQYDPPPPGPKTPEIARLEDRLNAAPGDLATRLVLAQALIDRRDYRAAWLTCWPAVRQGSQDERLLRLANRSLEQVLARQVGG